MPQYELGKDHYLHHRGRDGVEPRLHTKGERIEWNGPPSLSMIPIDAAAKKAKADRDGERAAQHEQLKLKGNAPRVGWTPAMEQSFTKSLQPEASEQQVDSRSATKSRRARN